MCMIYPSMRTLIDLQNNHGWSMVALVLGWALTGRYLGRTLDVV